MDWSGDPTSITAHPTTKINSVYLGTGATDGTTDGVDTGIVVVTVAFFFLRVTTVVFLDLHLVCSLVDKVAGSIVSVPTTIDLYFPAPSTRASPQVFAAISLRVTSLFLALIPLMGYFCLAVKPVTTT